jgi:hypothetical protein
MALNRPFYARSVWMDLGEQLDVSQVVNQGGAILAGQAFNNQLYGTAMAIDGQTAHAGGGQANGVPITAPVARFTTVATAADSATLPSGIRGMEIIVFNDAAVNAMNVFPAVGETINALAANTAFSVIVGTPAIFVCTSNGAWHTK